MAINTRLLRKLSAQDVYALEVWALQFGRCWKRELRHAWETGDYQGYEVSTLQALRNSPDFGPAGLIQYRALGVFAAEAAWRHAHAPLTPLSTEARS